MSLFDSILGSIVHTMTERGARGKTYADFQRAFEKTGQAVHGRFTTSRDTPGHREKGQHIVGIERWSQSRLRVALGEAYKQDEYDGYRPGGDLDMGELAQAFADARAESSRLAQALEAAAVPLSQKINHNQMGEFTIGAWFNYIILHASRESRML
jgi:hypothetical protein